MILVSFKRFIVVNWKMRRFKRSSITSRKRSCLDSQKMSKECCGTKEGSVYRQGVEG
jgi:hypothetical protein